jgi:hypothetical protein
MRLEAGSVATANDEQATRALPPIDSGDRRAAPREANHGRTAGYRLATAAAAHPPLACLLIYRAHCRICDGVPEGDTDA